MDNVMDKIMGKAVVTPAPTPREPREYEFQTECQHDVWAFFLELEKSVKPETLPHEFYQMVSVHRTGPIGESDVILRTNLTLDELKTITQRGHDLHRIEQTLQFTGWKSETVADTETKVKG